MHIVFHTLTLQTCCCCCSPKDKHLKVPAYDDGVLEIVGVSTIYKMGYVPENTLFLVHCSKHKLPSLIIV
jgi:hypothetical protein